MVTNKSQPTPYPPGVTNPTPPPSRGATPYPRTTTPSVPATATGGGAAGPYYPAVGTSTYDVYRIHEMMQSAGYDGWEMIGQPVQVITQKVNPQADPSNPLYDPSAASSVDVASQTWIVNIRKGNQIKQIKMSKLWPTAGGGSTQSDPGDNSQYTWSPTDVNDVQTVDPNKVGHSGLMTIGTTIYGTNNTTGAFEPVPGAPQVPKGWQNAKQVQDKDGSLVWYGEDPQDQQFKPMPGLPVIPPGAQAWGDPQQIDDGQGHLVWYGTDPSDKQRKPIPNQPVIPKVTGPASVTQAGTVYVQKPDGTYGPAPGVPDPNPPVGSTHIKLGDDGYLYQEKYAGGGRWELDPTFKTIPYSAAAQASAAKTAGTTTHQAGETGDKLLSDGKVYRVIYKGGGDDNYEVDTSVAAKPMAGTVTPSTIATSTDQPNIVQRMPDGSVQTVANPNYQATDPALRVQQLSNQATTKLQELQAKIGANYTPEQAQSDFDQWWSSTVEPAKQQLASDQQQKQLDTQLKIAAEQRAQAGQESTAYSTAQQAGTNAVEAAKAGLTYMHGPGYGNLVGQLVQGWQHPGAPGPSPEAIGQALTFDLPNFQQIQQQAVAQALAHISPTAAALAGGPGTTPQFAQPQQLDLNQLLNRNAPQYQFHVNPAGAAATTVATPTAPRPMAAPVAAVPGQNYGANVAYTGGVPPWLAQPYQYQGSF